MTLVIEVSGDPIRAINRAIGKLFNASAMDMYGQAIRGNTLTRAREEVDPAGDKWVALTDAYASTKTGPGILRESGDLMRTLVVDARASEVLIGTDLQRGEYHQQPDGETDSGLPQREWLGVTDEDITDVSNLADDIWERAFDGLS